jgi:DNA (cytosine-5)-methyltransferase 1
VIKTGSDFSGVGAFDQALRKLGINYQTIYACDWDKYSRQTYIENYGEPTYFPKDVYEREIPKESLDLYMTSPPCQAFSLAGKRKGEDDERGILFYNSHEFIQKNNPRYFIFENVRGLLSDADGVTFKVWLDMLGGKSVNGNPVLFPNENSTPYHIYWQVLNAKHYGVPQNRERVFIIGIRDDADNTFRFPKTQHLNKKLKDVLEYSVDDKYFLSEKMVKYFTDNQKGKGNGRAKDFLTGDEDNTNCLLSSYWRQPKDGIYLKVPSATKKGFEIATDQDSINFSVPNSKTRRGRVGKGVAQTLDTACNQGVISTKNKRVNQNYNKHKDSLEKGDFMDSYNQTIHKEVTPTITTRVSASNCSHIFEEKQIRRLTPRECFRLMDFPEDFKWSVSDTQAYKQAGNSIVVNVLAEIINKLNL